MDEQNQTDPPPRYIWPRYVAAGVVLGIVLAIVWMAVLVHRLRGQREDMSWPTTNATMPIPQSPTQAATNSPAFTNSIPAH